MERHGEGIRGVDRVLGGHIALALAQLGEGIRGVDRVLGGHIALALAQLGHAIVLLGQVGEVEERGERADDDLRLIHGQGVDERHGIAEGACGGRVARGHALCIHGLAIGLGAGVAGVGADHVHHELVEDVEHLCVILTQDRVARGHALCIHGLAIGLGAGVAGVGADHVHHELVEDVEHLCVILTQDTALEAQEQREVVAELGGDVDIGQDFDGGRQVGQVDAAGTGHHVGDHVAGDETALEAQEQREVVAELGGDVDIGQDFDGGRQVGQVDAAGTGHHVGDHVAGDEVSEPLLCRRILCHATSLLRAAALQTYSLPRYLLRCRHGCSHSQGLRATALLYAAAGIATKRFSLVEYISTFQRIFCERGP